ncbi:DUF1196 domain-containing protein [Vibrio cholerae]|nr:DUF1196 domain-containing protein [Vibrio cholerae]TQQ36466.1 DUF1196 domain-containing protein [Vibrio cholerae]
MTVPLEAFVMCVFKVAHHLDNISYIYLLKLAIKHREVTT